MRSFTVEPSFGGEDGLRAIRGELRNRGLRLFLDFIPNHLAPDHRWTETHPERFVPGTGGERFAHGKDPYFPPWTDTVQLDYRRADVRAAMIEELLRISEWCDGVRCDMAMLVLGDVFRSTWGGDFDVPDAEFWRDAIAAVRQRRNDFLFLAEAYWGKGDALRSMGFDATYDKDLYDRLRHADAASVREHLRAPREVQDHLARFVENHDEERAARAFYPSQRHRAAATVTLALPGVRLLHDGQLEGRTERIPVQLRRRPDEALDPAVQRFYGQLLPALSDRVFSEGEWRLLEPRPAWPGNETHRNFVAFTWTDDEQMRLVAVNLSGIASQCYLQLGVERLAGQEWYLYDVVNDIEYRRHGDELLSRGLYLDVPAWFSHLFVVQNQPRTDPVRARGIPFLEERGVLRGDGNPLQSVAWSPDGETIAYGGAGGIWLSDGRFLTGHESVVGCLAWSPDGRTLASGSDDRTVRVWEIATATGRVLYNHHDNVVTVAFSPDGKFLASAGVDRLVVLHDLEVRRSDIVTWRGDAVNSLAWSPDGSLLACGSGDQSVAIVDVATRWLKNELRGSDWIGSVAWSPDGKMLASGTGGGTVDVWDARTGQHVHICEGHTQRILSVAFSPDSSLLVSKSADGSVRFWDAHTWETYAALAETGIYLGGLSFHAQESVLATRDDAENVVRLWNIDLSGVLRSAPVVRSTVYKNAKVVLVGDSGVGKTALAIRLVKGEFEAPVSTVGTWATQLPLAARAADEVESEIWLWDFAGQPDYRLVHQLYMNETSLAVLVFDPQKDNAVEGLTQWDWDIQRAVRTQIPKLLVAGRIDVARVIASRDRLDPFMRRRGYLQLVETSALTGEGCDLLRGAIAASIPWDEIPSTVSPRIFRLLKEEIIRLKDEGRVLFRVDDLRRELERRLQESFTLKDLRAVIGLLSGPAVVWPLDFGDFVLLQPELINSYAGAVIRTVRAHPAEIGVIAEEALLNGQLDYQDMKRLEPAEEEIVLRALDETLLRRGICLRTEADGQILLVFPSFYRRERGELAADLPAVVSYRFEGSLDEIYSTLIVRVYHAGAFGEAHLWRYAAEFCTPAGERLALKMVKQEEARAELTVYAEVGTAAKVVATFTRYVDEHLRRADPKVIRIRHYVCAQCRKAVSDDAAVQWRLGQGLTDIGCQRCEARIPLWDLLEELYGSDEVRQTVHELSTPPGPLAPDDRELNMVGKVKIVVSQAHQIYRGYTGPDIGIDGEIEFKDDLGHGTGLRLYLQLKSGDSYLYSRKKDGAEVFTIKKPHHALLWQRQRYPVMLVIDTPRRGIRWMEISSYLRRETEANGGEPPTQIVFRSEPFTADSVWEWRRRALAGDF